MTDPFGTPMADPFNPMQQDDNGPSTVGYLLGALFIILGIGLGVWWGVSHFLHFQDTIDDFQRVPVGEVGRIDLERGEYVVYAERGGGTALSLFVTNIETRPRLEFRPYTSDLTYDLGGRTGRAQSTFTVDDAREYRVRSQSLGSSATTVAFGPSVAGDLVSAIVGGLLIGVGGVVLGILFLIVTGRRRSKYRRRNWMAGMSAPGAPSPGTWNPPAPGTWNPPTPPPPPPF